MSACPACRESSSGTCWQHPRIYTIPSNTYPNGIMPPAHPFGASDMGVHVFVPAGCRAIVVPAGLSEGLEADARRLLVELSTEMLAAPSPSRNADGSRIVGILGGDAS